MMTLVRMVGLIVGLTLMIAAALAFLFGGVAPAALFALEGAVILAGVVFERVTYKAIEPSKPGPGWMRTPERFVDDASGKPVTVYVRTATGERKYVNE
jgi:hypothetical protein